jgi:hypothetical protein
MGLPHGIGAPTVPSSSRSMTATLSSTAEEEEEEEEEEERRELTTRHSWSEANDGRGSLREPSV